MKYIIPYYEFNNTDKNLLVSYDDNFTISYELEVESNTTIDISGNTEKISNDIIHEYLPNFYEKYNDIIETVLDISLINGFEIKPIHYINSLSGGLSFVKLFLDDMSNQSNLHFDKTTSMHINIGFNNSEYNYLKLLLFLNEVEDSAGGFAYSQNVDRFYNKYCKPLKNKILFYLERNLDLTKSIYEIDQQANEYIKKHFIKHTDVIQNKFVGFRIKDGYIEFRYIGGDVNYSDLKNMTQYFAYLIMCSATDHKKYEYYKKLSGLIYKFKEKHLTSHLR